MRARGGGLTIACVCVLVLLGAVIGAAQAQAVTLTPMQQLGRHLFFDRGLSEPAGQACADCHGPSVGYTGPDAAVNAHGAVYVGAAMGRWFGNRKPPSAAYCGGSPTLTQTAGAFTGGMFWDGRANGLTLGDPLAEQAGGPFLNPWEQNDADAAAVVVKVQDSAYARLFTRVWGAAAFGDAKQAYTDVCRAIAAYERSPQVSPFTSRYDTYRRTGSGLTAQERQGLALFKGKAGCSSCHVLTRDKAAGGVVFTDYRYANLGLPRNPQNPWYLETGINPAGASWVDTGLGGALSATGAPAAFAPYAQKNMGKFKVPTLRNVAKRPSPTFVKAYGHNGAFKSLREVVHFLNTRDVPGAGWRGKPWPAPEYPGAVNTTKIGHLGLSAAQEKALVAFLGALSDR
jgi:cytochrome c peroxidase